MAFTPLRTGDSTVDRNLDSLKASLSTLTNQAVIAIDTTSYVMPIGASVTAPTKGSISLDKATYWAVNDRMGLRYDFFQTTAGTAGNGLYLFQMPPGFVIDSTQIPTTNPTAGQSVVGPAQIQRGTEFYNGIVQIYDNKSFFLSMLDSTSASGLLFSVNSVDTPLNLFPFRISFSVPSIPFMKA